MRPVRIGVVGAGYMGTLHAQKISLLEHTTGSVVLSGVADIDPSRAKSLARHLRVPGVYAGRQLHADADAVVVAVPTLAHHEVVCAALDDGLDVLVEKPLAATIDEGDELLRLARVSGCVLQVGHIEWFNAVIPPVRDQVTAPKFVEARRMGPFTARATDVDVVRDLMIHDIDILQQLLGAEPTRIQAVGAVVISDKIDVANARLEFPDGCVASLTASRVAEAAARRLRIYQRDCSIAIDFLDQSVAIARRSERHGRPGFPAGLAGDGAPVETEEIKIDPGDALLAQLGAFVDAIRSRRVTAVTGAAGLGALRTALRVLEAMPGRSEVP